MVSTLKVVLTTKEENLQILFSNVASKVVVFFLETGFERVCEIEPLMDFCKQKQRMKLKTKITIDQLGH